jgi:predicted  nucleic acid-binding Zn-ribbon protein
MTDSDVNNPININISKESKFDKAIEYNEFKKYIIVNNIALQEDVKQANNKIKTLESQIQNQEETEDKYDKRIGYMKGLLQNLNELRNDYNNVSKKTEEKLKFAQESNKKIKKLNYEIYTYLVITNAFTLITPLTFEYFNIFILLLQTFFVILMPYCFIKIKNSYNSIRSLENEKQSSFKDINNEINKIKVEIIKTEQASISVDNWINEI